MMMMARTSLDFSSTFQLRPHPTTIIIIPSPSFPFSLTNIPNHHYTPTPSFITNIIINIIFHHTFANDDDDPLHHHKYFQSKEAEQEDLDGEDKEGRNPSYFNIPVSTT